MIKKYFLGKDKRLCLISDIHFYEKFNIKKLNKIVNIIKGEKPDYIIIAGDIIDYTEASLNKHMEYLYGFIKDLANIAKVIICLGNHDISTFKDNFSYPYLFCENLKHMNNVVFLDNSSFKEEGINFIGYTQSFETLKGNFDDKIIEEVSNLTNNLDDSYNILISHNPLYVSKEEVLSKIVNYDKINLILSGHTHNGMLPNFVKTNNLLISPDKKWFYKNGRGYLKRFNTDIIISGGITKLSRKAGILRFFNFLYQMNIDLINISINKK